MYRLLCILLNLFFTVFFHQKVSGIENIPQSGGVIIAANHKSFWDPPVIGAALPRIVYWMAKQELFSIPVLGWIIKVVAFPVRRGMADRNAIRKAMLLLAGGKAIAVFPEGTRSKTGELLPGQPGVAMLAIKAGVPIIPTAVIGTNKIFKQGSFFPQIKVIFGQPIETSQYANDKTGIHALTLQIMGSISQLIAEQKEK